MPAVRPDLIGKIHAISYANCLCTLLHGIINYTPSDASGQR